MVNGGISHDCKMQLVEVQGNLNAQRYINEVLDVQVLPHFANHNQRNGAPIYQQDGASIHTAGITMAHLQQANIEVLPWPAKSPDLSPIENIWSEMEHRINNHPDDPIPTNRVELRAAVWKAWNSIDQTFIRKYTRNFFKRVRDCIAANGSSVKY